MGFNVDGRSPSELTIGAVGAERWEAEVHGRAAHAGVHPERGISATMIAALALEEIFQKGWFGKIKRGSKEGTSNVGSLGGVDGKSAGAAANVVTDFATIKGEARSHNKQFVKEIVHAYRGAFARAASRVRDANGRSGKARFRSRQDYLPFRLSAR